jgi:hypothetical protein
MWIRQAGSNLKSTISRDVTPCSWLEVTQSIQVEDQVKQMTHVRQAACFLLVGLFFHLEDGGSVVLRNGTEMLHRPRR